MRFIVISVLSTGSYFKGQSAPHTPMLDLEGVSSTEDDGGKDRGERKKQHLFGPLNRRLQDTLLKDVAKSAERRG